MVVVSAFGSGEENPHFLQQDSRRITAQARALAGARPVLAAALQAAEWQHPLFLRFI